ncbi:helix-turn-helix domain-containing protein [Nocardioides marmoribigeumensis]|uniref:DNA-binding transcriptional ArsR family regulator n=1 Tax=Nocardioides marmoribigeumensis TaxID=433649 RepID=A0ABU2BV42_9ACTN|nr:helix-turn-helix domain-containing protein [Nocardioides marmoribigeumensis]MDR7362126.1 DNA-binding transcriptional ArsR family regulator [Nocardioides marmoribigeumensis]
MPSADLLLHPVRLRVVQSLLGGRTRTTGELRDDLPDVPPATLYRHVALLADAEVLEVVDERRVRGAFERTYRLREAAAVVGPEEAAAMSVEDHRQAFTVFVAGLLRDFDRYLEAGDVDLGRDLVGYRQAAFHLTDEETAEMLHELASVLIPRLANEPAPDRRRRMLSTIVVPDPEGSA